MVALSLASRFVGLIRTGGFSTQIRRPSASVGTLAAFVAVPLAAGQVMGIWSAPDVASWYPELKKPDWTPPTPLFPIVWSTLYTLMGFAAHRVWTAGAGPGTMALYALQLGLNLAWQPLFFKAHDLKAAAKDSAALVGTVAWTVMQFSHYDTVAGRMMLPYLVVCTFAAALTVSILRMNGNKVE